MIKAKTASELADYIEAEMAKIPCLPPGIVLRDANEHQMRMIVEHCDGLQYCEQISRGFHLYEGSRTYLSMLLPAEDFPSRILPARDNEVGVVR